MNLTFVMFHYALFWCLQRLTVLKLWVLGSSLGCHLDFNKYRKLMELYALCQKCVGRGKCVGRRNDLLLAKMCPTQEVTVYPRKIRGLLIVYCTLDLYVTTFIISLVLLLRVWVLWVYPTSLMPNSRPSVITMSTPVGRSVSVGKRFSMMLTRVGIDL